MEGCNRRWCIATDRFLGEDGRLVGVQVKDTATGETEVIKAEMALLAMGFVHVEHEGIVGKLGLSLTERKNILAGSDMATSAGKVFVAGDATNGASLVVRAIASGRQAAAAIDKFLKM